MRHYDEERAEWYAEIALERKKKVEPQQRPNTTNQKESVFLDIEHSDRVIEPDAVDDHFRDLIRSFSPIIYKEMDHHNQFYKLQEAIYEVAAMTGWIDE